MHVEVSEAGYHIAWTRTGLITLGPGEKDQEIKLKQWKTFSHLKFLATVTLHRIMSRVNEKPKSEWNWKTLKANTPEVYFWTICNQTVNFSVWKLVPCYILKIWSWSNVKWKEHVLINLKTKFQISIMRFLESWNT